jgi:hypothetical protein
MTVPASGTGLRPLDEELIRDRVDEVPAQRNRLEPREALDVHAAPAQQPSHPKKRHAHTGARRHDYIRVACADDPPGERKVAHHRTKASVGWSMRELERSVGEQVLDLLAGERHPARLEIPPRRLERKQLPEMTAAGAYEQDASRWTLGSIEP